MFHQLVLTVVSHDDAHVAFLVVENKMERRWPIAVQIIEGGVSSSIFCFSHLVIIFFFFPHIFFQHFFIVLVKNEANEGCGAPFGSVGGGNKDASALTSSSWARHLNPNQTQQPCASTSTLLDVIVAAAATRYDLRLCHVVLGIYYRTMSTTCHCPIGHWCQSHVMALANVGPIFRSKFLQ